MDKKVAILVNFKVKKFIVFGIFHCQILSKDDAQNHFSAKLGAMREEKVLKEGMNFLGFMISL